MTSHVALLRAVNVGGTGRLPMTVLAGICEDAGFEQVRTFIASGNVVFRSALAEQQIRGMIERGLRAHAGKAAGVLVRTGAEIADMVARNPFPDAPANRVMALVVDGTLPTDPLAGVSGLRNEQLRLGKRELFVFYPDGMATTRLRIPAEAGGTARNMNTIARLAGMAAATTC